VDFSGRETVQSEVQVKVENKSAIIADSYTLRSLYPNPFNASFTVPFTLNENLTVKVSLYNIAGQQVMSILNQELSAGDYHFAVNADDLCSGVYFLRINLGKRMHTQKMVLMK